MDPLPAAFTLIRSVKCAEIYRGLRNNLNIAERKMKSPVKMDIKTKVSGPWGHPWFRSWS